MKTPHLTRRRVTVAAITLGAGLTAVSLPAHGATGAQLSVLHGVPGLTVDVWVNGERTLDDFTPGTLAGPLDLPAGTYTVAITASDAADDSAPAIGPVDLPLMDGGNYTAVAHLDAAGTPTATLFTNDTSATMAGQGRLTVRHVAAAPVVDVLAGGSVAVAGLANPQEKVLNLPVGTLSATVAATGTTTPVIGPADVVVADGVNTIAYAWGSLEDGNLALATQTVKASSTTPDGVPAGRAGFAATEDSSTGTAWLVGAGIALLAAVGAFAWRSRRTTQGSHHGTGPASV